MIGISVDFRQKDTGKEVKVNYYKLAVGSTLKSQTGKYPMQEVELLNEEYLQFTKDKNIVNITEKYGVLYLKLQLTEQGFEGADFTFKGTVLSEGTDIIRDFLRMGLSFPKDDLLLYFPSVQKVIKCWELPLPETDDLTLHNLLIEFCNRNFQLTQNQLFNKALMIKGSFTNTNGK